MIAESTLEVAQGPRRLLLGPYREAHIQKAIPLSPNVLAYQPAVVVPHYTTTAQSWLEGEANLIHTQTWGIFFGEHPPQHLTPERLKGHISITRELTSDTYDGRPAFTETSQEISRMLFYPNVLSKGVGSLALLAIAKHILGEKRQFLSATTSPQNIGAQRSLAKVGFRKISDVVHPLSFANGTFLPLQRWELASEQGLEAIRGYSDYRVMANGRD